MSRLNRTDYYLGIAKSVSKRSTCLRANVGAVIVKNDVILSTGYNGAARGVKDCAAKNICERQRKKIPSGTRYEECMSVHAEANACLHADYVDMQDATMYLYFGRVDSDDSWAIEAVKKSVPCMMCKRILKNCHIKLVVSEASFKFIDGSDEYDRSYYYPSDDEYFFGVVKK